MKRKNSKSPKRKNRKPPQMRIGRPTINRPPLRDDKHPPHPFRPVNRTNLGGSHPHAKKFGK